MATEIDKYRLLNYLLDTEISGRNLTNDEICRNFNPVLLKEMEDLTNEILSSPLYVHLGAQIRADIKKIDQKNKMQSRVYFFAFVLISLTIIAAILLPQKWQ